MNLNKIQTSTKIFSQDLVILFLKTNLYIINFFTFFCVCLREMSNEH